METLFSGVDPKLRSFLDSKVPPSLVQYLSKQINALFPNNSQQNHKKRPVPFLPSFVALLVKRSHVPVDVILASLVFMRKLKERSTQKSSSVIKTLRVQDIFLGSLILTAKYLHDISPDNKSWLKYTTYYTRKDLNRIEKNILVAMEYYIKITDLEFYNVISNYQIFVSYGKILLPWKTPEEWQQSRLDAMVTSETEPFSLPQHLRPDFTHFGKYYDDIMLQNCNKNREPAFASNISSQNGSHKKDSTIAELLDPFEQETAELWKAYPDPNRRANLSDYEELISLFIYEPSS
ncbi:unnamed protein product [Rhizopus stolonifer]